jgi:hypothetical protein
MATARRSSSAYGGFADGILVRGMPLLTLYPGNIYWVDSNGGGGSKGTFNHPVLTLAAAESLVTSNNGDIIVIKPGHAETYTATVSSSKSGYAVIGLGFGTNRPTFTNGVLAAGDDMFEYTGDNVLVYNIMWKEAAPAGSAAVIFNVSGSDFCLQGCYLEMGAKTLTVLTHDTTAKKNLTILDNTIIGTAAGPDACFRIEKTHLNAKICNNFFSFAASAGLDSGIVMLVSGTTASGGHLIKGNIVLGLSDGSTTCNVLTSQAVTPTNGGLVCDNYVVTGDVTDVMGITPAGGFAFINNVAVEPASSAPGTVDNAGDPLALTPAA